MSKMKLIILFSLTLGFFSSPRISYGEWFPYSNRYAVVIMGANVSGQMYFWYWNDTGSMYRQLIDLGFIAENIFFLSYGDSANVHPEMVDKTSTKANVQWAFNEIKKLATNDDLVYVFWISHGDNEIWECHDQAMTFSSYHNLIKNINAKIFIGAYNPCFSGAVIPHISKNRLITATSVNASEPNSYGWAGKWRAALRGGYESNPSDKNNDGHISIAEAYEWEAQYSLAAGEHPLMDDNGDGKGGLYNTDGYDQAHMDSTKDGYFSSMYSLTGYYIAPATPVENSELKKPEQFILSHSFPNPFNPTTNIEFYLPSAKKTIIKVYDTLGHEVITILDQNLLSGNHRVLWNGKDSYGNQVSSGVYFCKIQTNEYIATSKMILLR